jgi:uncharacterized repeat protein (TIGR01451 family)
MKKVYPRAWKSATSTVTRMKKITSPNALLLTFCAVGVLAAGNPAWANNDATITNCAQVTATTEGDVDSIPDNKAGAQDIIDAIAASAHEDDEACAPVNVISVFDYGDAPDSYGTSTGTGNPDGAAVHEIIPGLHLGQAVDEDADGAPGAEADLDETTGTLDEDGYDVPSLTAGADLTLSVRATNTTDTPAKLFCWIDYNGDGVFAADGSESGSADVPAATAGNTAFGVVMPPVPATVMDDTGGSSYARCRLSTDAGLDAGSAAGALSDGEVEDKKVTFVAAPVFDLALTKKLTNPGESIQAGETVSFDITVTNQGTRDATGIKIIDYIPAGFELADADWTISDDETTATLNTPLNAIGNALTPGSANTVTITLKAKADISIGDKSNYAEIYEAADDQGVVTPDNDSTADQTNGNDGVVIDDSISDTDEDQDDHDVAVVTVAPSVDVELSKSVEDSAGNAVTNVRRGDTLFYVLVAENKGPDDATNVVVSDQLPDGLTYVNDDTAGVDYDHVNGSWTVGDLNNGAAKSLRIEVIVD